MRWQVMQASNEYKLVELTFVDSVWPFSKTFFPSPAQQNKLECFSLPEFSAKSKVLGQGLEPARRGKNCSRLLH